MACIFHFPLKKTEPSLECIDSLVLRLRNQLSEHKPIITHHIMHWLQYIPVSFFSKIRFIQKNGTQSVFTLHKWLAYRNIAERIRNKNSALDFSFSALIFFNMDLKSKNGRKTTKFSIFLLKEDGRSEIPDIQKKHALRIKKNAKDVLLTVSVGLGYWNVTH